MAAEMKPKVGLRVKLKLGKAAGPRPPTQHAVTREQLAGYAPRNAVPAAIVAVLQQRGIKHLEAPPAWSSFAVLPSVNRTTQGVLDLPLTNPAPLLPDLQQETDSRPAKRSRSSSTGQPLQPRHQLLQHQPQEVTMTDAAGATATQAPSWGTLVSHDLLMSEVSLMPNSIDQLPLAQADGKFASGVTEPRGSGEVSRKRPLSGKERIPWQSDAARQDQQKASQEKQPCAKEQQHQRQDGGHTSADSSQTDEDALALLSSGHQQLHQHGLVSSRQAVHSMGQQHGLHSSSQQRGQHEQQAVQEHGKCLPGDGSHQQNPQQQTQQCSSEQATNSLLSLPTPENDPHQQHSGSSRPILPIPAAATASAAAAVQQQRPQLPQQQQHQPHPSPPQQHQQRSKRQADDAFGATAATSAPATAAADAPAMATSRGLDNAKPHALPARPTHSAGVGSVPVLPPSFLEPPTLSAVAASYSSISPFEMLMPALQPVLPEAINDAAVAALIAKAQETKRAGDQMRIAANQTWRMGSLTKYVEASLKFMEACELMARMPASRGSDRGIKMESVYTQTAELLGHAIKYIENMVGSELGKGALRILCERLSAVCYMRAAAAGPPKYEDCARRINSVLREHAAASAAATATAGLSSGAGQAAGAAKPQQQSPDGSTHSSVDAAAASTTLPSGSNGASATAPPSVPLPDLGMLQSRLLSSARQVARYSDLIRRSTNSFQRFIESREVVGNQDAKLAAMHMAVVCLNVGMMDSLQLISHANEAISHIKVL